MFTDLMTCSRNFYIPQRNPLPITSDIQRSKILLEKTLSTNLFFHNPILEVPEENFDLDCSHQKPKPRTTRSVMCQTTYRESSAQTEAWLPDGKVREGELRVPEVALVECYKMPGLREVEAIERARFRRNWENQLPGMSPEEFPLRIAQLEAFEWENLIAREREVNENQMNRMKQVEEMIEVRYEMNRSYSKMMMENLHKRSLVETQQKKNQMEIANARKMRRLMKKSGNAGAFNQPKVGNSYVDVMQNENDVKVFCEAKLPSLAKSNLKVPSTRDKLWNPKKKVTEIAHGVRSDKNLKALNQTMVDISSRIESPKVRCKSKLENLKALDTFEKLPESNSDLIVTQKTVKGAATMNLLKKKVCNSFDDIQNLRQKFRIDAVFKILPEQYKNLHEETESHEKSQVSFDYEQEEAKMKETVDGVKLMINEILDRADEVIIEDFNRNLLQEAEKERLKRQEENRLREVERARRAENQLRIDGKYEKIAEQVLEKILPCVLEKIAEEDSKEFMEKAEKDVDEEACNSTETESETARRLLHQVVVPEVERRVEHFTKPDDEICNFVAENDTFDGLLKEVQLEEATVEDSKTQDLLEETLGNLEI